MENQEVYYWIRVYEYDYGRDMFEKGTLLDEFYIKDPEGGREGVKKEVRERYANRTANDIKFAKPKKQSDGIYAIVMDSNKSFFVRFYATINTYCFQCLVAVNGKASGFPHEYIGDDKWYHNTCNPYVVDPDKVAHFCSYDCKAKFGNCFRINEGEWQTKEEGRNGDVFGYVYLIYNRAENTYYIGQTRFMPFFRWQEHVKDGGKGEISDMSFSVLAEIYKNKKCSDEQNQQYLNSIEAWWIAKYQLEGHNILNITKPKITIEHLKNRFKDMVLKQEELQLGI